MKRTKSQFRINDRVVVTDSGECFTGYTDMFDELGFKHLNSNPAFEEGTSARIFNICEHPHSDCWLIALVDDEGNECLTSNLGITLAQTDTTIKINDLVRITNPGKIYTTYEDKFASMGFKNKYENSAWIKGEIGRVFAIDRHETEDDKTLVAIVHADGRECLINVAGIELIQQPSVDSATIDRMSARLAELESRLDQLAKYVNVPEKPKTAVEWLIEELTGFDYGDTDDYYDICLSLKKFQEIKEQALLMETNQNCK